MRGSLALVLICAACSGGTPPTPKPVVDLALPLSTSDLAAPDGLTTVNFGADGLLMDGKLVAKTVNFGSMMEPEGISEYGETVAPLQRLLTKRGRPEKLGEHAVVAVPGTLPFRVPKGILRSLYVGGIRKAFAQVRTSNGQLRVIPLEYPRVFLAGDTPLEPSIRVILGPEGATVEGLGDAARSNRLSFRCQPDCSTLEGWPMKDITRMAARARVQKDIRHVEIVPHNDVRWEVVIAALDATRDDLSFGGTGRALQPHQTVAGIRELRPSTGEILDRIQEKALRGGPKPTLVPGSPPAP